MSGFTKNTNTIVGTGVVSFLHNSTDTHIEWMLTDCKNI